MTRRTCGLLTVDGTQCKNPPGCAVSHPLSTSARHEIPGFRIVDPGWDPFGSDADFDTKEGAAKSEYASPDALAKFASDPDPTIRLAVAGNSATPGEILERLVSDPDPNVQYVANQVLVNLPDDEGVEAAADPNTPPDELIRLAQSESIETQEAVASNPSAPAEALDAASSSWADEDGHCLVAVHPNTSKETLDRLATEGKLSCRGRVAANPNTSKATLARLADDIVNRPGSDGGSGYWIPTPVGSVCWAA